MTNGQQIWTMFLTRGADDIREEILAATVVAAEHRLVRFRHGGEGVLHASTPCYGTACEARAACAAKLREIARELDARADRLADQSSHAGEGRI